MIDDVLARRYFPDQTPIGKRINLDREGRHPLEVIGVVGHVKQWGLDLDDTHSLRAQFYLDLYAREGKQSGAWMDDAINRRYAHDRLQHPVAYLTCNFSGPIEGREPYFTHREVITLFHEFGHGLHQLLTRVDVAGVSGL